MSCRWPAATSTSTSASGKTWANQWARSTTPSVCIHRTPSDARSAAAVARAQVACSTTGKAPADPAGRGDVAVERADVGAVAARRTLDDLAVPEPERDVAAVSVAVAEEDEVARPVAV